MKTATKEYIRPMPATWWLNNRQLVMFMIRELTAVFAGAYAVFLLVLIALDKDRFIRVLDSPVALVFQLSCLLFVLYHTYTWFEVTPKAIVLWRGDEKVAPSLIVAANYAGWLIASVAMLWWVF
jgi:fumarate reductase subunit C